MLVVITMKNLITYLLITLLVCSYAFGQERSIDERTYNEHIRKASTYRLTEKYRARHVFYFCDGNDCAWKPSHISVMEFDHPNKMRSYMINTQKGDTEPSTVFLHIDGKQYAKHKDSDWKLVEPRQAPPATAKPDIISTEFKDLGTELIELNVMRVFEKVVRLGPVTGREDGDQVQRIKSWIDPTGRLSKQEFLMTRVSGTATRLTIYYEVDPEIKIEVPKL